MHHLARAVLAVVLFPSLAYAQSAAVAERCTIAAFKDAAIEQTAVRAVRFVSDGSSPNVPSYCRVEATVTTSPDSVVNFEVWIPQDWNGKIVVTGNGGYSNAINVRDMAHALSQRYAAAGGDTGHQTPTPDDLWQQYWGNTEPTRAAFWRHWVFRDPTWDWWSFDFDRHIALADERLGGMIDQVNPDISAFKARGGKAIVYHGWQDPVSNALDTIAYYEQVRSRQGSQQATDQFFRMFLVPGMGHCAGGTGTTSFGNQNAPSPIVDADHDLISALDAWVERGVAPAGLVASRVVNGATTRTRPLCSYPMKAIYTGTGSTDDAANFVCR
jgi:Tannase and feruloyl esterase